MGRRQSPEAGLPPGFGWQQPQRWRLDNGLTVLHLAAPHSSLVATVVSYRVGAAAEQDEICGIAHFLEHMMFKGSARWPTGEIDRRTQLLGGWNNAFTSHDSTVYLFGFASDRWEDALVMEADRMRGLTLGRREVDSERRVVNEEISLYLDDPWDALELEVLKKLFGEHPYGRPILGTRDSLAAIDGPTLNRFHADHYGPQNAVLVVAGDVERAAVEKAAREQFGAVAARAGSAPTPCSSAAPAEPSAEPIRVERRKGETARMLMASTAPAAGDADHPRLVLATALLTGGRTSRLHRRLVEDLRLCSTVSAEVTESVSPGAMMIAAEAMPGVEPESIEEEVCRILEGLAAEPPGEEELDRARRSLVADWVFGHERIHQRAMLAAAAETLFDSGYPERHLRAISSCTPEQVQRVVAASLPVSGGSVIGWSLPGERR